MAKGLLNLSLRGQKNMKCLDTTFLIDFLKSDKNAINKALEIKDDLLITTSVNVFEVLLGIYRKKETAQNKLDQFKKLIANLNIVNFDVESSFKASKIEADLISQGKEINAMDSLVAGTMISKGCDTVITRDKEHFERIKGLKAETY